jgi:hypothetical protein
MQAVVAYFTVISRLTPSETEENLKNPVELTDYPADIKR